MRQFLVLIVMRWKMNKLMLTCNEKDVLIIPASRCETMVYEVQKQVDKLAREQGKPYGRIVSTRRLDLDKGE